MRRELYISAFTMGALFVGTQARAQDANEQIAIMKKQLQLMEQKLSRLENKKTPKTDGNTSQINTTQINPASSVPRKAGVLTDAVVSMPKGRPTVCTADGRNCIGITANIQVDGGAYDYHPNTSATAPQRLNNGVNARRARFGVAGKFLDDWRFSLIYDVGGNSDGFGGTAAGSLPSGGNSGLQSAGLAYWGFRPFDGQLVVEGGYLNTLFSMDGGTPSYDDLFMERAPTSVLASTFGTGAEGRAQFGARWFNERIWAGAYVTGPQAGAIHTASSTNPPGTSEQLGTVARATAQIVQGQNYDFHLGVDAGFMISPPTNYVNGTSTFAYSARALVQTDPASIVSTGPISGFSGAQTYGIETAATYGAFFYQGEYYSIVANRDGLPGLPDLHFSGGYAQMAYALTGERRQYSPATGVYQRLSPQNPFDGVSGWGAWEIAGRFDVIDLNSGIGSVNGIVGGRQTSYTLGLNWYINDNLRLTWNYVHQDLVKQISATNAGDAGSKIDAVGMRAQITF